MHSIKFLFAVALLFPSLSYAAFSGLVLSPQQEIVRPQSAVTITATSIDRDVNALEFVWKVDGKVVANEIGLTRLTVTAPAVGASMEVSAEVKVGGRTYATEKIVLRPAELYLESDARSSVPPFYIGERRTGPQGSVVFSAIPHFILESGVRVPPSNLFFEWRVNAVQKIKPTLGKSSAEFEVPFFNKPFTVTVTAYTRDGTLRAQESTFITPARPTIVMYESSPLGGISDQRAVRDTHTLTGTEVTLVAYPLFTKNLADVVFKWYLNGSVIDIQTNDSRSVTFRKTAEGTGSYSIDATFSNPSNFLERASRTFLLQF